MYTRDIRTLVQMGKSGVKWNSDAPVASTNIEDMLPTSSIDNLKRLWDENTWRNPDAKEKYLKALEKTIQENQGNYDKLITDIDKNIRRTEDFRNIKSLKSYTEFKETVERDYTELAKKNAGEKEKVVTKSAESVREIKSKDISAKERDAFIKYLDSVLTGKAKEDMRTNFTPQDKNTGEASREELSYDLAAVSIPNLINHLINGEVYTPRGYDGNIEAPAVK
jgi:hypothetical protein